MEFILYQHGCESVLIRCIPMFVGHKRWIPPTANVAEDLREVIISCPRHGHDSLHDVNGHIGHTGSTIEPNPMSEDTSLVVYRPSAYLRP